MRGIERGLRWVSKMISRRTLVDPVSDYRAGLLLLLLLCPGLRSKLGGAVPRAVANLQSWCRSTRTHPPSCEKYRYCVISGDFEVGL